MRSIGAFLLAISALLHTPSVCYAQDPAPAADNPDAEDSFQLFDPIVPLLRDSSIRKELALTDEQRGALDQLLQQHNRMLLAVRDVGLTGGNETTKPAVAQISQTLNELLTDDQANRLEGLVLQAQGYNSLLRSDITDRLQLTEQQVEDLAQSTVDFHKAVKQVESSDGSAEAKEADLKRIQSERHARIIKVLTSEQQTRYGEILGEPFEFSKVRPSPADAPEFTTIEEWINSKPLTMQSLRGRVVVIHFFAFGCSNCINNYPWYREWHDAFQGQDVTIIGIHTPETSTEENNDLLRAALDKHGLHFPVAVDKQKKMWQAWYNGIWPSVYLVDKQGRVRYWWYGELDWQGAGGQRMARQRIEQLLAE